MELDMAEKTTPEIVTPKSAEEVPGGIQDPGVSQDEAAQGLFDALAEDDEFSDNDDGEEPTPPGGDADDDDDEGDLDADDEGADGDDDDDIDDEGDLDDDDDDDSDDESDDDDDDGDDDGEDLYEVTLPGGEKKEVTLDELTAGYSRTEDYTRKRQRDAAEHTKAMAEVREVRSTYADRLEKLEDTLQKLGPQEPTQELRKSNPGEYAAQMAEYQVFQDTLKQVGAAQDAISDEEKGEQEAAKRDLVNSEWEKVVAVVPEWADQDTAVSELASLRKHAIDELGFSEAEIDGLVDHRLMLMLKENFDLKQKRKKGRKVVETKKKTSKRLKPGTARTPARKRSKAHRRRQKQADQLAAQSGSVTDAARAIELLLDDE
jgi:uncharacterized protein YjiS (DUF1127 family)